MTTGRINLVSIVQALSGAARVETRAATTKSLLGRGALRPRPSCEGAGAGGATRPHFEGREVRWFRTKPSLRSTWFFFRKHS